MGDHSPARSRLLGTASRLFYAEGLHSVGIDRIVAEARVTRATLYRHFPSKDRLVVAYLTEVDEAVRARLAEAAGREQSSADVVRAVGESIAADIRAPGFRGCAFLNAAAEYPDPAHPVRRAVLVHREWFLRTITDLLAHAGATAPDPAARHFVMLRDGAMAAGSLADPERIGPTFLRGVEGLLKYRNAHMFSE